LTVDPAGLYRAAMRSLAAFVSGRRGKWATIALWIVLAAVFAPLGSKLADKTDNRTESFLPKDAESTKVERLIGKEFPGGQTVTGLIVYERPGGLTAADKAKMAADARAAARKLPLVGRPVVPFQPGAPPDLVSPKGDLAYSVVAVPNNNDKLGQWGKDLRKITGKGSGGLKVYVTGNLGFTADFDEVFGSVDTKLLGATVLLVLVLLGAIYRSPLIALIPLVVVGFAYVVAQGLIYLYADSGATVSSNSTQILVVLLFGVGTDYCLLLVSRYREELHQTEDKHEAMARAVRRAGPAILASGTTVILAMLVLLVAKTGSVHSLGPVCAIGVACVLLAGLTLLPGLLAIAGRRGFWPRQATVAYDPDHAMTQRQGLWRRIGDRVLHRPGLALGVTVAIFAAGSLGLLAYKEDYSTNGFFKKTTEAVEGYKEIEKAFPAGALAPTTVLVHRDNGPVTRNDVETARQQASGIPGIAAVTPPLGRSSDGRYVRFDIVFKDDPNKQAALNRIPLLRDRVHNVGPGVTALVGAGSAINYDFNQASARDIKLIVPIALAVIAVILAILLQAIVAPLVLIATVVASFFGTLGLSFLFFRYVDGQPGLDASLPTFAFIFLVALGVDYTIFLMSRAREEARRHGTREGMLRAIAATGPVITSAGLILAGTFSVLMTLPVTFAFNIGFMVAVGILLDTFVVRTIMVPAAVELIGDKIWWPSSPSGGRRVLGESAGANEPPPLPEPAGESA
jgi:putative drug exporter of the RND superfamily